MTRAHSHAPREAGPTCPRFASTPPVDADAWRRLAASFAADARIPEAIDAVARAHQLCSPKSGQVLLEVSRVLETLAKHVQTVPLQLKMAKTCSVAGFLDRAILHVEKALEHEGDNVEAHRELADLCWRRGRHEEAIDALHRVLWLKKDDIDTALQLAERLVEVNRQKSAMMIVRRISDRVPGTGEAELRIGRLLRNCGAPEAALWRLEKAVVLIGESAQAHFELALAYIETGRPAAAVEELIETCRLRSDWGEPLRRLAYVYRELSRPEDAAKIELQLAGRPVTLDLEEIVPLEAGEEFGDSSELSGRLQLMPVVELLQFLAQRNLTGVLRVNCDKGGGSIEIYRGTVIGAQLEGMNRLMSELDAEEYFSHCQTVIGEMIGWTEGQIDFISGEGYDKEPRHRFEVPHLLLETIRRIDEANA